MGNTLQFPTGDKDVHSRVGADVVLSLDIDDSDNKVDDGNTSGIVAGEGATVVVEIFLRGLDISILCVEFSVDTDVLKVQYATSAEGFMAFGNSNQSVKFGTIPPGMFLSENGYLGTVVFTTTRDVTDVAFNVFASVNVACSTDLDATDEIIAEPLSFNANTVRPSLSDTIKEDTDCKEVGGVSVTKYLYLKFLQFLKFCRFLKKRR